MSWIAAIRADLAASVPPRAVRSVRFNYDGNPSYRIENLAPYAIGGDVADLVHGYTL